jgi:hypothetical protein
VRSEVGSITLSSETQGDSGVPCAGRPRGRIFRSLREGREDPARANRDRAGPAVLLLGPHGNGEPGPLRPRTPGSVDPLEFLGPLARHYELYGTPAIPSGIRRPGERDVAPVQVDTRAQA